MEILFKYGFWGAAGFLLGIFLVTKAEPTNVGGVVILLAVGLAASAVLRGVWWSVLRLLSRLRNHDARPDD